MFLALRAAAPTFSGYFGRTRTMARLASRVVADVLLFIVIIHDKIQPVKLHISLDKLDPDFIADLEA